MAIDRGKNVEIDPEELLEELQGRLERLRALYEQYFMGIERMEPQTARKEVTRKIAELQQLALRNTALRYRFNMLTQKFGVYQSYWNRTVREIEKGTYFRDVARLGRAAASKGEEVPDEVLRTLPERLRARVMRDRDAMRAKRARDGAGADGAAADGAAAGHGPGETGQAPLVPGPAPSALPARSGGGSWLDADDDDIDSALDNLFGEAEAAVSRKPAAAPTPKAAPSSAAAVAGASAARPTAAAARPTAAPPPVPSAAAPARPSTPPPLPPRASTPPPIPRAATAAPTPVPPRAPTTPVPRAATPPVAVARLPEGVDEKVARELHQRFVSAKRSLGEATDHIKVEHIAQTIAKQTPAIMQQHGAKAVDFQVVVKDGKAILKAVPKK